MTHHEHVFVGSRRFTVIYEMDKHGLVIADVFRADAPREGETLADLARSLHVSVADFEHAAEIARRFGFPLDPQIEALLARPTG